MIKVTYDDDERGSLYLSHTPITSLPENLSVCVSLVKVSLAVSAAELQRAKAYLGMVKQRRIK